MVVALKLLEPDTARIGRLRRELQAARRVTHPNVVRIYDLLELPGELGLSMEYVEGETLASRLEGKGALPVADVVALARDLAHALRAAHAAGVTHRDLKPANVILREGGKGAAVTDFGIARMHDQRDAAHDGSERAANSATLTFRGVIVGTPLYMAPEQLEGRTDIGPAADVYAFGLVLREAATAERLDANAASLDELRVARASRRLPRLAQRCPDLPPALARVVDRCLSDRPEQRYADGTDLARAVDAATTGAGRSRWPLQLGLAVSVAVLSSGGALWVTRRNRVAPVAAPATSHAGFAMHVSHARRITFGECEEFPSFTPDGASLVYDANSGENFSVFVMDLAGGSARQLTKAEGWDFASSVSPDGRTVAFLRNQGAERAAYVVPIDGSTPPRLLVAASLPPWWSPDGETLWTGDRHRPTRVDAKTGGEREALTLDSGTSLVAIREVADGGHVGLATTGSASAGWGVVRFDKDGKARNLVVRELKHALLLTPDGRHVLVSGTAPEGSELLAVALDGSGTLSLAETEIRALGGMALSADGRRMAWSTCAPKTGLAQLDGTKVVALRPDSDWADEGFVALPGSRSIVTLSPRTGRRQPWVVDLDGKTADRAIPVGDADPIAVAASSDGWLALVIRQQGIVLVPLDGSGPPRYVTRDPTDHWPSFRHDGKGVVFTRRVGNSNVVMSVPRDGGTAEPLLGPDTYFGMASPVDDRVVFLGGAKREALTPRIFDPATGKDRLLSPALETTRWAGLAVSADGRNVALSLSDREIVEVDVGSGAVRRRVKIKEDLISLSYVGDTLLFSQARYSGNLLVADVSFE
jgi:Tol biopolymer transport system component